MDIFSTSISQLKLEKDFLNFIASFFLAISNKYLRIDQTLSCPQFYLRENEKA